MSKASYKGLHEYYKDKDFKPTFTGFTTDAQLDRYEIGRRAVFRDLLHLPPSVFEGARVCEFGPDTGENALVFARWGAQMTLVEPHAAAWDEIRAHFKRYGLTDKLEAIVGETIEDFQSEKKFDVIVAEGFIYTVQPSELWLKKFASLLVPGGLAVASYLDRAGCLFELLWTLCYTRYQELAGEKGIDAAWSIFEPKWNSIPHTRPFESWVRDVLENPYVRLKYLIDPAELSSAAFNLGLSMYSSWPRYEDPFHPFWHKGIPAEKTLKERRRAFIERSRLSFAFARQLFVISSTRRTAEINASVLALVGAIDDLIDKWSAARLADARAAISVLDSALSGADVMADDTGRADARAVLASLRALFDLFGKGDAAPVREFLRTDRALIDIWGSTTHYMVLRPGEPGR